MAESESMLSKNAERIWQTWFFWTWCHWWLWFLDESGSLAACFLCIPIKPKSPGSWEWTSAVRGVTETERWQTTVFLDSQGGRCVDYWLLLSSLVFCSVFLLCCVNQQTSNKSHPFFSGFSRRFFHIFQHSYIPSDFFLPTKAILFQYSLEHPNPGSSQPQLGRSPHLVSSSPWKFYHLEGVFNNPRNWGLTKKTTVINYKWDDPAKHNKTNQSTFMAY